MVHGTMRRRAALLAVLVAVGGGLGCEGDAAGAEAGRRVDDWRAVRIEAAAAGSQTALSADEVLVVALEGRPATGRSWSVASIDAAVLRQVDTGLEVSPGLGGTDRQLLYFLGVKAGATELVLRYGRPWERAGEREFRARIAVAAPFAGTFRRAAPARSVAAPRASIALPSRYDLCALGGCTPVKDQGGCGSCWAFATTGVVESLIARADGVSRDLSEQYLLSCNAQRYSCAGGWVAFDLFEDAIPAGEASAGAVYGADQPYLGADAPCGAAHPHHERLVQWGAVEGDVTSLKQGLLDHGALWVGLCADGPFSAYAGGVFEGSSCGAPNHAVTLVGWDDADGGYWIIKNSWGAAWGEQGYMRLRYGANQIGAAAYWADYVGARCGDGLTDGDESDVDCGGSRCGACAVGRRCRASTDCAAGASCQSGVCAQARPCAELCSTPAVFAGPHLGASNLGTGTSCYETTAQLASGQCGNFAGARTLDVNGVAMACSGASWRLPAPRNGGYCIRVGAGDPPWAWFTVW